jgi:hypothetical protein
MLTDRRRPWILRFITWILCFAHLAAPCIAQVSSSQTNETAAHANLKAFLQAYVTRSPWEADKTASYRAADVELDGDGVPEILVYLEGASWCGSGGCVALVLKRTTNSFKVVSHITISRMPIRVLTSTTNGWRDIAVWVQGGGILSGYEAKLPYNGVKYPGNPTAAPAQHLSSGAKGEILINPSQMSIPLYP